MPRQAAPRFRKATGKCPNPRKSCQFINDLREHLGGNQKVSLSEIADKDGIYNSIKDFLGKGR